MSDLGTLGGIYSRAGAINDSGQITGQAYIAGNTGAHAFLYSTGKMTNLVVLNDSLLRDIEELLARPAGRPSHKPVVWYKGFLIRRRVGRRHDGWWRR